MGEVGSAEALERLRRRAAQLYVVGEALKL
jgi:hypothetical protein